MRTLKELVENQQLNGMSDIQVIRTFFEWNDMEEEGMELIYELSQAKVKKLKSDRDITRLWVSYLPSEYLYETYDLETASNLHILELDYLTHAQELSESRLKWARENVPNIKMPRVYFQPLVKWLKDQGIEFRKEID